jgi:hypothetical protein
MSRCASMDSTFMGVLAGLSYSLKNSPGRSLKLINLSERNEKLLTTLGVDKVVNYSLHLTDEEDRLMAGLEQQAETLDVGEAGTLDAAKTTLEAHQTLVNLNPDNLAKFESVLELLQKDVDKLDRD